MPDMITIKYYKIKQGSTIVGVKFSHSETTPDKPEKKFSKSYFFQDQKSSDKDTYTEINIDDFQYLCMRFNVLVRLEDDPPGIPATC